MNFDYGRQMAEPNYPFWGWGYLPPVASQLPATAWWNPYPGYGTFPAAPAFNAGMALSTYGRASDDELKDFVERAIDRDPSVPPGADIDVDVKNGAVTLTGTVANKRIKHAVGDDAWFVPQVLDVHNQLQISAQRKRGNGGTREGSRSTSGRRGRSSEQS